MGSHVRLDLELNAQTHSRIENDNILQYYLHDEISSFTLVRHQTSTQEYQLASELFINLAIDQLDSLIDLDQSRQYDQDERDIRIYSLLNHSGWEQNTVGQVTPDDRGWSNQWNNTSPSASLSDLDIITNQLGIDPHQELHLKTPDSKQQLKQLRQIETNIIYEQTKGQLFYDTNNSDAGLEGGGLVARLKGQPVLQSDHLQLWSEPAVI